MSYSIERKSKAVALRKQGFSLKEISQELKISKSTASLWLSTVLLSTEAWERLAQRKILGQYKTILIRQQLRETHRKGRELAASQMLQKITLTPEICKLCCALMWWCEGNKATNMLRITSSDKSLITNFLSLLRSSFKTDPKKFRALVHVHRYHNELKQREFWSKVTSIPLSQFNKSFQKPNTGVRTQDNYQGCVAISYYNAKIAKELEAIYNSFTKLRGVG